MSGENGTNGNGRKKVGVLELILLLRKHPELQVEPCCSTGCRLRIPECRGQDGLGHMQGSLETAMCYLKQRVVEVAVNGHQPGAAQTQ